MYSLQSISEIVGGTLVGDPQKSISNIQALDQAGPESISFLTDRKYVSALSVTQAGAVLLHPAMAEGYRADHILVENPYLAYAKVSQLFETDPPPVPGIHETAVIAETAKIGEGVSIGAHAVISDHCVIGNDCMVGAGVFVGAHTEIGAETKIYPNCSIYHEVIIGKQCLIHSGVVIGAHGFGFAPSEEGWVKICQIGRVIIEDRVELGANSTVDRGALQDTIIRENAIIDNLVMVAHNCEIGSRTAIAGQAGVAGSAKVGSNCLIGGQTGIAGHISVSDNTVFTGQAMVPKSIKEPGSYSSGIPIMESREWRRTVARIKKLDEMTQKIKDLEKAIKELQTDE